MFKNFLVIGAIILISATGATAQQAIAKQCAGDIKTLCAGVQQGEGRIKACVKSHFSDLSAPCQAVLVKAAAVGKACRDDVKKICADVKPGGGKIEACMKTHLTEVSEPCKDAITQAAAGKN
jgi:Cysteine rich repeat